jgi:hypothetical protein
MLFDLTGKRRRLIQVVYATLAILMGGSLVLFGIGSDAPGGILDALGLSDGSTSGGAPQYEDDIEDAEERLEANPNDERALADLALARYRSGSIQLETNEETGLPQVTSDAREDFVLAQDAWARYLKQKPKRPDAEVATNIAQLSDILFREALAQNDAREALSEAETAAEAYRVAADASGRGTDFGGLATYLYISGEDAAAKRAADRAVELAPAADRKQLANRLEKIAEQTKELNDELEKLVKAGGQQEGEALQDPLGGLGPAGGGGQVPPSSP